MYRSHTCGELTAAHDKDKVVLSAWVRRRRDHGGLIFIDLADRYGMTQIVFDPESDRQAHAMADSLRSEYVIRVEGSVRKRPEGMTNPNMTTGEIEVLVSDLQIVSKSKTPPFELDESGSVEAGEEVRLKHRYLDLRRQSVQNIMQFRAKMNKVTRDWFSSRDFTEVQTPIFTVSSPEGARDFVIPSRLHPGQFYALPQAPQQYKQLLMVGGLDKYFQIAPCFRDEDPRADRHSCEFYQIDVEMSFVTQEQIFEVAENFMRDAVSQMVPDKSIVGDTFHRLSYHEAMSRYGTDKPDLRFGMEMIDISDVFAESDFAVFKGALDNNGVIKCIKLSGQSMTRKEIDQITAVAQSSGAKGLAYIIYDPKEGPRSPILKFFSDAEKQALVDRMGAEDGDILFFGADSFDVVTKALGSVRLALRDKYNLAADTDLAFTWVTDFPMFEKDEKTGKIDFGHNPFSIPAGGIKAFEQEDVLQIMSQQYDLALNGYEVLSGSIRNHDLESLTKAFEMVGRSEDEVKSKFGAMYEAFQYGVPPHGGFAFGFDRLLMIFMGEENIREIYAFPKSGKAQDAMMQAPAYIDEEQLDELHIQVSSPRHSGLDPESSDNTSEKKEDSSDEYNW
ncbi:MAG: aspartate--tRNA ligase [Patescibacteria group bacterium]|nr:aspartate--tRNA ligase [Patescibacteria group bacterium]